MKNAIYVCLKKYSDKPLLFLQSYCKENNIEDYKVFIESVDLRADINKREELNKLKQCVINNEINNVYIHSLENISRYMSDNYEFLKFFNDNDCSVKDIEGRNLNAEVLKELQMIIELREEELYMNNNELETNKKNQDSAMGIFSGNVANIGTPYETANGKKRMRFDLAQNRNNGTQFFSIIMPTKLVETYGQEIQKGDWLFIKGNINSVPKKIEKDGKTINTKEMEFVAQEIEDRTHNKTYISDGQVIDNSKNEMER